MYLDGGRELVCSQLSVGLYYSPIGYQCCGAHPIITRFYRLLIFFFCFYFLCLNALYDMYLVSLGVFQVFLVCLEVSRRAETFTRHVFVFLGIVGMPKIFLGMLKVFSTCLKCFLARLMTFSACLRSLPACLKNGSG